MTGPKTHRGRFQAQGAGVEELTINILARIETDPPLNALVPSSARF
jgi:hypothetical protein